MTAVARIQSLIHQHSLHRHRTVIWLKGEDHWAKETVLAVTQWANYSQLVALNWEFPQAQCLSYKQARQLLGSECHCLLINIDSQHEFDANGFNAACGAVIGGGLVVIIGDRPAIQPDEHWFAQFLNQLEIIEPEEYDVVAELPPPKLYISPSKNALTAQSSIIPAIEKVMQGHRKRPLVITADRGRGKSSGMGIALGQLVQQHGWHILVTAPSKKAVEPLFYWAAKTEQAKLSFDLKIGAGRITFIAPDELLECQPVCDGLVVDEAAALPLPSLYALIEIYHRAVFSTTIHGYEGCGRGFTLKFLDWLNHHRPGWNSMTLDVAMRWGGEDPLEKWLYKTFLLNTELSDIDSPLRQPTTANPLIAINKLQLIQSPSLAHQIMALLVNAHYQTTPNDFFALLHDDAIKLYITQFEKQIVGVLLTVDEGGIDAAQIALIQQGQRRPSGHLVATTLANQLAFDMAIMAQSTRVMRIAVHPQLQRQGLGKQMLQRLIELRQHDTHYISTSFGATIELAHFWRSCGFQPLRLGTRRDHTSGTFSAIYLRSNNQTFYNALQQVGSLARHQLLSSLKNELRVIDNSLLVELLHSDELMKPNNIELRLLSHYILGGASYVSILPILEKSVPNSLWRHLAVESQSLLIDKVLKNFSWVEIVKKYSMNGKKQAEQTFRKSVQNWLDLHCKLDEIE